MARCSLTCLLPFSEYYIIAENWPGTTLPALLASQCTHVTGSHQGDVSRSDICPSKVRLLRSGCTVFIFSLPFCDLDADNAKAQGISSKIRETYQDLRIIKWEKATFHARTEEEINSCYVNHEKVFGLLGTAADNEMK